MDADDSPGAPVMAVLSYEAWQRDYAGTLRLLAAPSG